MRKYLATLHKRPDIHKKRFAFLVSGVFTMLLFVSWSLVNFGLPGEGEVVAVEDTRETQELKGTTPFESLGNGVAAAFQALTGQFGEIKEGLKQVDIENEYGEMRNKAFDTYGR